MRQKTTDDYDGVLLPSKKPSEHGRECCNCPFMNGFADFIGRDNDSYARKFCKDGCSPICTEEMAEKNGVDLDGTPWRNVYRSKNILAYKMVEQREDGRLYPPFVGDKPFVPGKWIEAEHGELNSNGKVKARGMSQGVKPRPGFHLTVMPYAPHLGVSLDGLHKPRSGEQAYMRPGRHWMLVEVDDSIDYQQEAHEKGLRAQGGKFVRRNSDLQKVPRNGIYFYKTNPNAPGDIEDWIIAGHIRPIRLLSDEEVEQICAENGYRAVPRLPDDDGKPLPVPNNNRKRWWR